MRPDHLHLSCVILAVTLSGCVVAAPRASRVWVPAQQNRSGGRVPGHYR